MARSPRLDGSALALRTYRASDDLKRYVELPAKRLCQVLRDLVIEKPRRRPAREQARRLDECLLVEERPPLLDLHEECATPKVPSRARLLTDSTRGKEPQSVPVTSHDELALHVEESDQRRAGLSVSSISAQPVHPRRADDALRRVVEEEWGPDPFPV